MYLIYWRPHTIKGSILGTECDKMNVNNIFIVSVINDNLVVIQLQGRLGEYLMKRGNIYIYTNCCTFI